MDEEGVMNTEDNSLLVVLEFGVKKLPAIENVLKEGGRERE